jgi:F0F1-type ATP synthase assembly protein I
MKVVSQGIKHQLTLIRAGLVGLALGAGVDLWFDSFPLGTGVGMLVAELVTYLVLRVRYGASA